MLQSSRLARHHDTQSLGRVAAPGTIGAFDSDGAWGSPNIAWGSYQPATRGRSIGLVVRTGLPIGERGWVVSRGWWEFEGGVIS